MAPVPASLRALLARSIDYAGLFPPASLELETSLKNYAGYLRANDSWMLSIFVLPIAKFADAAWFLSEYSAEYPLRVSALGPKTTNEIDFSERIRNLTRGIRELSVEGRELVRVEQIEMPLPSQIAENALDVLSVRSFWETSANEAKQTIAALAKRNADTLLFGFKLRTGGVTADAFPSSAQIASALVASARNNVPIKFTAGLHHPVRMFRDEVKAKMHGFLNVLGAGVLAIEHSWDEEQTIAILDDEEASAFKFSDNEFGWRDSTIATERVVAHRQLITSFGSCSFDEPREDLRELGLL